jgi:hypothetical protein
MRAPASLSPTAWPRADEHVVGGAGDARYWRAQAQAAAELADHRLDVARRAAPYGPPARTPQPRQHAVIIEEVDQEVVDERGDPS